MSTDSVKRFDRIVAILVQLQSRRIVKAQDLADRFNVSLRTIYRDVRTLEASGVPILSEAGVGYSIMEGYRLPPVMFTREEAGSFVAAEKFMQQFLDNTLGSYHASAMYKIKSVLKTREKDWVSALESQISVVPTQELFNKDLPDALDILFGSIGEKTQVYLKYQSTGSREVSERYIEPVGLFHENGFWYVLGYCHSRNDYRQFRTDRMQSIRRTSQPFSREHESLEVLRKKGECSHKTKIRLLVDEPIARYLVNDKKNFGFVSERSVGDQVEMTFMTYYTDEWFPRWYMMFCDRARILEPESLKKKVQALMKKGGENLAK